MLILYLNYHVVISHSIPDLESYSLVMSSDSESSNTDLETLACLDSPCPEEEFEIFLYQQPIDWTICANPGFPISYENPELYPTMVPTPIHSPQDEDIDLDIHMKMEWDIDSFPVLSIYQVDCEGISEIDPEGKPLRDYVNKQGLYP